MAICVYAEHYKGVLEPVTAELIAAARKIQETTKEEICSIVVAKDADAVAAQVSSYGVDKVYVVKTEEDLILQDDAQAVIVADMLRKIQPSAVLIPATPIGRSVFSRVAIKLGCGMTADCTELLVGTKEDGSYYIKQNKPSFGDNVFVTIITREGCTPQMMTVRPGVYEETEKNADASAEIIMMEDISAPASKIEVLEVNPAEAKTDGIMGAEVVVVAGKGALEDDNFELLKKFADKIGAAVGGTRPIIDGGLIPFEDQIGQSGFTIRPEICLSFGVSGAIQHTEGIKDTKLYVAVNTDPDASIFNQADYGMTIDMKDLLNAYLDE